MNKINALHKNTVANIETYLSVTQTFKKQYHTLLKERLHGGNNNRFLDAFLHLPKYPPSPVRIENGVIKIGPTQKNNDQLKQNLMRLKYWRKGPYNVHGITIDAEWQSQKKWARLAPFITPYLNNKIVLDIGCNNGYYMYHILQQKAKYCLGIDPVLLYFYQFHALKQYITHTNMDFLLIKQEEASTFNHMFDTVLSMGILYHRKDPIEALKETKKLLRNGGTLLLETLIINKPTNDVLVPKDRYAQMRNVYHIPTIKRLKQWLEQAGYTQYKVMDITQTNTDEQRETPWTTEKSLASFLNPENSALTIENYPAPTRVIILCN